MKKIYLYLNFNNIIIKMNKTIEKYNNLFTEYNMLLNFIEYLYDYIYSSKKIEELNIKFLDEYFNKTK